jgi:spermidine/putrescine transport system ATP-binding protein
MVFQSLALFPHRTVGQNIEFPLKIRGEDPANAQGARPAAHGPAAAARESYYGKNVMKCSGGERQRVALARALAYDPQILFFDEPLSAIDYKLRKTLEKELKDIHRETNKTFIYITHSLEEAMVMSDRIGVMRARQAGAGRDTPRNLHGAAQPVRVGVRRRRERHSGDKGRQRPGFAWPTAGALVPPGIGARVSPAAIWSCGPNICASSSRRGATTPLEGRLYNEYVLGSRIQYQVRVGENVFVVEKLRQQALQRQARRQRADRLGCQ